MTDSLIVARALLRLGPFADARRPARRASAATRAGDRMHGRSAQVSAARPRDPWCAGPARAAFAIWATNAVRPAPAPAEEKFNVHGRRSPGARR
jgi:hypothetical protein